MLNQSDIYHYLLTEPELEIHHEGYPCHSNRIVEQLQEEEQWWQEARKRLKEWAKGNEYEKQNEI